MAFLHLTPYLSIFTGSWQVAVTPLDLLAFTVNSIDAVGPGQVITLTHVIGRYCSVWIVSLHDYEGWLVHRKTSGCCFYDLIVTCHLCLGGLLCVL